MAIHPGALASYLRPSTRKVPDFKSLSHVALQGLIEQATGKTFEKTKGPALWEHQFRAVAAALYLGQSLSFLGMRTGKTRVTLEWLSHLSRCGLWKGQGLIIVPSPTVLDVWDLQIPEYCNLTYGIVRSGSNMEFMDAVDSQKSLIVISWPALQQLFSELKEVKRRGKEPVNKRVPDFEAMRLASKLFTASTIDEIHYCQNPDSLNAKCALNITTGHRHRLGLTGTPFGRNPYAVWSQGYIVDGGKALGTSYHFFQMAFAGRTKKGTIPLGFTGRPNYKFDKAKLPILADKLRTMSISYELSEIRKLNEKKIITRLRMTPEQAMIYTEILEDNLERRLSDQAVKNITVALRRISSGQEVYIDDNGNREVAVLPRNAKLTWLRGQMKIGAFAEPTIIFYSLHATGEMIAKELTRNNITFSWLHGGVTSGRGKLVSDFQAGHTSVFLANSQSGSEAIDLSTADHLVFFEPAPSSTKRTQAEKRPMAASRGERLLTINDLIASPVEEKLVGYLAEGKDTLTKGIHSGTQLLKMFKL